MSSKLLSLVIFLIMWRSFSFQMKNSARIRVAIRSTSAASSLQPSISIECETPEDIENLGAKIGQIAQKSDVILLRGDLGAGKTCFSRGFIRSKVDEKHLRVTSPSYLLDNTYEYFEDNDEDNYLIHHMDLYRLPTGCDLKMLNIPEIYSDSICLIEWPQRMSAEFYPIEYLDIQIQIEVEKNNRRKVLLSPSDIYWQEKLQKALLPRER